MAVVPLLAPVEVGAVEAVAEAVEAPRLWLLLAPVRPWVRALVR